MRASSAGTYVIAVKAGEVREFDAAGTGRHPGPVEERPYRRKRGSVSYRMPGKGVTLHEASSGPDAPYGPRDARFWWGVVAVILVLIVVVALLIR